MHIYLVSVVEGEVVKLWVGVDVVKCDLDGTGVGLTEVPVLVLGVVPVDVSHGG